MSFGSPEKGKGSDPIQSLRDLGICLDESGRLRNIKNDQLITIENLSVDPLLVVTAITQYVQSKMVLEYSFQEIMIPLSVDCQNCTRSSIFGTKGCLVSETLVVVIPSTGTYPGVWSRSVCINEGLLKGTMLPFFHQAMESNMGIIVLNPYVNSYEVNNANGTSSRVPIPYNDTPDHHVQYVWDHIVSRTSAMNILIMAYGVGGIHAKDLIQARESSLLPRLRAMALTESSHVLISDLNFGLNTADSKATRLFLEKHTINWIASDLQKNQRVSEEEERLGCICLSAEPTTCNPGIVNYAAIEQIFSFFCFACNNYSLDSEKFYEELQRITGGPIKIRSGSEDMTSNNEVLVTNLPLSSNWIPDNMIEECQVCLIPFSFLVRKHHCRSCGRVVCSMCSKYRMVFKSKETPFRVCCTCYFDYRKESPDQITPTSLSIPLSKDDFQLLRVIGRGSFGKVLLVRGKRDNRIYALKILLKQHVIERNQVEHTKSERKILEEVNHPFLCHLEFAFQTEDKLFLGMNFLAGGPLFYHLQQCRRFNEDRARFYCAEVILGIGFLHKNNIIYRDMKPENLLLDKDGHVVITDFGLSIQNDDSDCMAQTICGTPEYVAPEVLQGKLYGKAVDWWSVGTLLYEMIAGYPPFYDKNRKLMFSKIMTCTVRFSDYFSSNACNLISRLLDRNPETRLGCGKADAQEVMNHPFFSTIDWHALEEHRIPPPWKPSLSGETDTSYFNHKYTYAEISDSVSSGVPSKNLPVFPNFSFQNPNSTKT